MVEKKYNIVLIEDQALVRSALRMQLERSGRYRVVREFGDGKSFIEAMPLQADVALLDLRLPGANGLQVMQWMYRQHVQLPVLILTGDLDRTVASQLYSLGLRGYVLKSDPIESLSEALESVVEKGFYNRGLSTHLASEPETPYRSRQSILEELKPRELEFLRLICDDEEYIYGQIASIMNVHRRTLDGYREQLFQKFGVRSRTGLVSYVHRNGLLLR